MHTYSQEGIDAFRAYAIAAAEEHEMAHELAQCAKIEKYSLLAPDLFTRVNTARSKTIAAFKTVERFKN
ncbi:hypothetical protein KW842_01915 [Duganella sp. sic0402]|uniref:hypothetical protein n=1 Tax=Duganella sp. sic0402 TaxID=2854786 RepID=UPI001C43722C|nr:hypothetical protein [Duganella sp. sic0402]MBV7534513.1 hypothetical protein [Duganella sp. sic0402]